MSAKRIESYLQFMDCLEYPMLLFEKDTGAVVKLNYHAQMILGKDVTTVSVKPDKLHIEERFWERLSTAKSLIWYRILIGVGELKFYVSGILNEFEEDGKEYCALIFESRGKLQHGSVTLERVINHAGIVAICYFEDRGEWKLRYISQNVNQYGYTSEQFYSGVTNLTHLMLEEDYKRLQKAFESRVKVADSDFCYYTYWVTENQSRVYVRMNVHLEMDEFGKVYGIDFLVYNMTDEQREREENQYLQFAINKSKSVLIVKRYSQNKRALRYVSPNATKLGFNIEALKKGYRLTEDYIHPEDRADVIDTVYKSVGISAEGHSFQYRIVGDDGRVRYVRSEITVTHLSDTEADVEFLITDITEEKEIEHTLLMQQKGYEQEIDFIMKGYEYDDKPMNALDILDQENIEEFVEAFVAVTGLYSVMVSPDGRFLTKPYGPAEHLGEFYDLFERPYYKQLYMDFNQEILSKREPVVMDMESDYSDSCISGAPILMDDKHVATWLICAFNKQQRTQLMSIFRSQWTIAAYVAKYAYNEIVVEQEIRRSRLNEMRLEKHIEQQEIIKNLLSSLQRDKTFSEEKILERVGQFLGVDNITCFLLNDDNGKFEWNREWNVRSVDEPVNKGVAWARREIAETTKAIQEQGHLELTYEKYPTDMKTMLMGQRFKNILMLPVYNQNEYRGMLTFVSVKRLKQWRDHDIMFAKSIRDILQEMFLNEETEGSLRSVNESSLMILEHLPQIIYLKDAMSGRIFYSNKAADLAFGMDLIDYDGNQIAKSLEYQFGENPVMRKGFVYNKNVSNWECYIKQLDKIMKVQEISVDWKDEASAKLVILTDKE